MEAITTGVSYMVGLVGDVFTMITGNPVLAAFVGCGLLITAMGLFGAAKSAAR